MNRQNGYLMIMNCVWLQEWTNSLPLKTKLLILVIHIRHGIVLDE
nr:MAG TPA: hypothetical protein [Caudoviricetes sp.]